MLNHGEVFNTFFERFLSDLQDLLGNLQDFLGQFQYIRASYSSFLNTDSMISNKGKGVLDKRIRGAAHGHVFLCWIF